LNEIYVEIRRTVIAAADMMAVAEKIVIWIFFTAWSTDWVETATLATPNTDEFTVMGTAA